MTEPYDVVVVGAGPAAWAAAAECGAVGLAVALVAPEPASAWTATYGCWEDEARWCGLTAALADAGDTVVEGRRRLELGRRYARFDNARLRATLEHKASGVVVMADRVVGRQPLNGDGATKVTTASDSVLEARIVIDASGHRPVLVKRPLPARSTVVQSAHGIVARFDRPPVDAGSALLMDWRRPPGRHTADPTFLYSVELGDGWFLAEETSLARSPALTGPELARRLDERLAWLGCTPIEVARTEQVTIPMNLPVPPAQDVVGFGAAGGFVHPATGYSVIASLRLAPVLAEAIRTGVDAGEDSRALAARAWEAIWPASRRRVRHLQDYGLSVLLRLDADETAEFFDRFFGLGSDYWRAYLNPLSTPDAVVQAMRALFGAVPWRLRSRLARGDRAFLMELARSFR